MQFWLFSCTNHIENCGKKYLIGIMDVETRLYIMLQYPEKYIVATFSGKPVCTCGKDLKYLNKIYMLLDNLDLVEVQSDKEINIFN